MSCVLRADGYSFDPEAFLQDSDIEPVRVFKRGAPRIEFRPDGPKCADSGFNADVSCADFDDLDSQVNDALLFLRKHAKELHRLISFKGVESVSLDFGINRRDVAVQTDRFPAELLHLAGQLGIDLLVTQYPIAAAEE